MQVVLKSGMFKNVSTFKYAYFNILKKSKNDWSYFNVFNKKYELRRRIRTYEYV